MRRRPMRLRDLSPELNEISSDIWNAAIEVHERLGPFLMESAYRRCIAHELRLRGRSADEEVSVALDYKGLRVESAYRIDILVDDQVIVELKCLYDMRARRLVDDYRRRALSPGSTSPRSPARAPCGPAAHGPHAAE